MDYPSRVQIWEWRKGKVIPKPKTIKKINSKELREELAVNAIKKYLPFISKEKLKELTCDQ
jgi:hypothetical protein